MGGYGSGRTGGHPTVEQGLRLDIARLVALGQLRPGLHVAGPVQWVSSRTGEVTSSIDYEANMADTAAAWMRLRYTITRRGGSKVDRDYRVELDTTAPYYGGLRWWFRCPVTGVRARVLYLPDGADIFASRGVYRLGYASQRQTKADNARDRSLAIRKKLGVTDMNTLEMPYAPRPKWMRSRTYQRLLAELQETQSILAGEFARRFGMALDDWM